MMPRRGAARCRRRAALTRDYEAAASRRLIAIDARRRRGIILSTRALMAGRAHRRTKPAYQLSMAAPGLVGLRQRRFGNAARAVA